MLAHLAGRLTERTEDIAVEALGYVLSQSVAARHGLQEVLRTGDAKLGELRHVRTQVSEGGTRPDLVGLDDNDREAVLIEAKFWAGLTDNQPNAYLKRLPDDGQPSVLLVVAPEPRLGSLSAELCRLADCDPMVGEGGLKSTVVTGAKRLMLTSWRALLDSLLAHAAIEGDRSVEADIAQLLALCQREDTEAFLPLRTYELGPAIPRRLLQLNRLIDDATEGAVSEGIARTAGLNRAPRPSGYGRYLRLGSLRANIWAGAWFGIDQELWSEQRETPLWLTFYDQNWESVLKLVELRRRLGEETWAGTERSVPIHLPFGVEREAVLTGVVDTLRRIAAAIRTPS